MSQPKIKASALDIGSGPNSVVATDGSGNIVITGAFQGVGAEITGVSTLEHLIVGDPGTEATGIDIGGVTYQSSFKVSDIDGTHFAQTILHRHSTVLGPVIVGARSNSNTSAHTSVVANQQLFSVYGSGYLVSNYKLFGVIDIVASAQGSLSDTSSPGKLILSTTPTGTTAPTQSLVIDQDKSVTMFGELTGTTAVFPGGVTADLTGNADTVTNGVYTVGAQSINDVKTFNDRSSHAGAYTPSLLPVHSATPTFDCAASNVFEPAALTSNVTSITMSNPIGGQTVQLRFQQDGTGGWTVTPPAGSKIDGTQETAANRVSWLIMTYSGLASRWEGNWLVVPL